MGTGQRMLVGSGLGRTTPHDSHVQRPHATALASARASTACACYATATSACPWPLPWPQPQPWPPAGFLRRAERGRLRPQAKKALRRAAWQGDFATLKRLVEEGVDLEAKGGVSAAPPARLPSPLHPSPSARAARRRCCPAPSPPPLTACGAAAAPPQYGTTALMYAANYGKLDCLEHLVAKGAKLEATDSNVSAAPPARPPSPLHPSPSALAARRPCCPAPRRRRSPRVAPPPRLRSTAGRPSCGRLPTASSTASRTSSPRVPSLTPQAT